MVSIDDL